jgi:16S rRNA (guanine(966)-N(2))-methyltransferase RsmD
MNPRIINGSAKGINLEVQEGVRPITDQAKAAMFSMLADDILDKRILDLFAGTGSIGLEALSRGAKSCIFVDKDRKVVETIKKNTELTGLSRQSQVVKMAVGKFVDSQLPEEYDVVFAGPPYPYYKRRSFLEKFLIKIEPLVSQGGGILIQHPQKIPMMKIDGLKHADTRCFGQVCISTWVKM